MEQEIEDLPCRQKKLQPGRYYVDGFLAENECERDLKEVKGERDLLAYLDVWEDSVNAIADAGMLEPALRGIDTSVRSMTRWALRTITMANLAPTRDRADFLIAVTGRIQLGN